MKIRVFDKIKHVFIYTAMSLLAFNSLSANSNKTELPDVSSTNMLTTEQNEFNKQYNIAFNQFKRESSALSAMKNPYSILTKGIRWGKGKKKLNYEENLLLAKRERFKKCQSVVLSFIPLASVFKNFTEKGDMTKDELMATRAEQYNVDYPFSVNDSSHKNKAHLQLFLKKGWEHRGSGECT